MNVWAEKLLRTRPRQPDRLSCGASSAVMARALQDEGYARSLVDGEAGRDFRDEVLAIHRRLTGWMGVDHRWQPPWPRTLGTPPWAVCRALSALGHRYVMRWARPRAARVGLYDQIERALTAGSPVALYVGTRALPRHVVLAVPSPGPRLGPRPGPRPEPGRPSGSAPAQAGAFSCYEPSSGQVVAVDRAAFIDGGLNLGGWTVPWFVVLPKGPE